MNEVFYLIPKYECIMNRTNEKKYTIHLNNIYTSEKIVGQFYIIDNLPGKPLINKNIFITLPYYDIENADNVIQNLLK